MYNLTTGLMTYFNATSGTPAVHNSFYLSIGGRLYKEVAPQATIYPYSVYHIISDIPEYTFTTDFENTRIQFDLLSKSTSTSEIENMFTYLKTLFDWKKFSITSETVVYMKRELARLTSDATVGIFVYNIDYRIYVERS